MSVARQKKTQWKLGRECTIYEAAEIREKLLSLISKAEVVNLNLSLVESVDSSFMQILVAAHKQARSSDSVLKFSAISDAVQDFAEAVHCRAALDGDIDCEDGEGGEGESNES